MLLTRSLLIVSIFFIVEVSKAQIGFSDWETAYFSMNATKEQKDFIDKVVFPRSIHFPKIKPFKYGFDNIHCWNIYLKKCFAAFFTESKSYAFNKTASLTYGILNLGNYDTFRFHSQLKSSINDTSWTEMVYNDLMPDFRESWNLLDPETQSIYVDIIRHTDRYLKTFNFQDELKYQKKLSDESNLDGFIRHSYDSSDSSEYRKAEAFVFRRIYDSKTGNGNWTVPWIRKMLDNVKEQLGIR
jgi:hypothetical protein